MAKLRPVLVLVEREPIALDAVVLRLVTWLVAELRPVLVLVEREPIALDVAVLNEPTALDVAVLRLVT